MQVRWRKDDFALGSLLFRIVTGISVFIRHTIFGYDKRVCFTVNSELRRPHPDIVITLMGAVATTRQWQVSSDSDRVKLTMLSLSDSFSRCCMLGIVHSIRLAEKLCREDRGFGDFR